MFDVGSGELLLIFIIGLLVLGPQRLPKVAAEIGKWVGRARRTATELRRQLEREIELNDIQPPPAGNQTPQPPQPPAQDSPPPAATSAAPAPTDSAAPAPPATDTAAANPGVPPAMPPTAPAPEAPTAPEPTDRPPHA